MSKPRKRASLSGYKRSGKGYVSPSGERISDYRYRSLLAKKQGWKNYSEVEKWRKSQSFAAWRTQVIRNKDNYKDGKWVGPDLSYRGQFVRDSYLIHKRESEGKRLTINVPAAKATLRADETELGRLLIAMGRIPADALVPFT